MAGVSEGFFCTAVLASDDKVNGDSDDEDGADGVDDDEDEDEEEEDAGGGSRVDVLLRVDLWGREVAIGGCAGGIAI